MAYSKALEIIKNRVSCISQWEWIANPAWIEMRALEGESREDTAMRLHVEYDFDFGAAGKVMEIGLGHAKPPLRGVKSDYIYNFDPEHPPEDVEIDYVCTLGIHPASSVEEMAEFFYSKWNREQKLMGSHSLVPGGHYHQILHYFTTTFDFEPTIYAAYDDQKKFRNTIERFARLTLKINEAWAMTGIQLMICHDDLAMCDRPIFSPDWYRSEVYPYYEQIWKPFKKNNIAILFMSDGKIDQLVQDLIKLAPAGLFVDEPCDLAHISKTCGPNTFLLGNIRRQSLQNKESIINEIKRVLSESTNTNNIILRASAGLDETIDPLIIDTYMDCVRQQIKK